MCVSHLLSRGREILFWRQISSAKELITTGPFTGRLSKGGQTE